MRVSGCEMPVRHRVFERVTVVLSIYEQKKTHACMYLDDKSCFKNIFGRARNHLEAPT